MYTRLCYAVTNPSKTIPLSLNYLWNNDNRSITLYVIEEVFSPNYVGNTTYKDVNDKGRHTESIEISLNHYSSGKAASDKVQVISQSNDIAFFRELQASDDLRYAIAAERIYGRNDAKNFCLKLLGEEELRGLGITDTYVISRLTQPQPDGFNAGIYKDYISQKYILSYQGTDSGVDSLPDWVANLAAAGGAPIGQYNKAINVAVYITGDHPTPFEENRPEPEKLRNNIILVGHSLGGGLASTASIISLLPAMTFNAAGVSQFFLHNLVDLYFQNLSRQL